MKYPSSYLGATFYHIAVASIQSKLEAQRKRTCLLEYLQTAGYSSGLGATGAMEKDKVSLQLANFAL